MNCPVMSYLQPTKKVIDSSAINNFICLYVTSFIYFYGPVSPQVVDKTKTVAVQTPFMVILNVYVR